MVKEEFYEIRLLSGIRLVHLPGASPVAHLAFIFNTGTRDEKEDESGIAHLCEHMLFKGTAKRKSGAVIRRMEDVGGDINAFTSKEEITVHSSFLSGHFSRAFELLADISFGSVFPEKELEKEKEVVIDEIKSYLDIPCEQIYEDIEGLVFPESPLGRSILGHEKQLKKHNSKKLLDFWRRQFSTDDIIICTAGNFSLKKVKNTAERILDKYSAFISAPREKRSQRHVPEQYTPVNVTKKHSTYQIHYALAGRAEGLKGGNAVATALLANILGGPAIGSLLNLSLREKNALAYNVECFYTPYSDTGIFGVYIGTDGDTFAKSTALMKREFAGLKQTQLSDLRLHKAKLQMEGQLAISQENTLGRMLGIGKSILSLGRVETYDEIVEKIERVSPSALRELANSILSDGNLSSLTYKSI